MNLSGDTCQGAGVTFLACNLTGNTRHLKVVDMSTQVPPPDETPGVWLTRRMEIRSTSVRQLADAMNVTTQTVYDWRGDRAAINEERIPLLAATLAISEIEARRGLGYWVPEDRPVERAGIDRDELAQLRQDLAGILERIDRLQEG